MGSHFCNEADLKNRYFVYILCGELFGNIMEIKKDKVKKNTAWSERTKVGIAAVLGLTTAFSLSACGNPEPLAGNVAVRKELPAATPDSDSVSQDTSVIDSNINDQKTQP